MLLVSCDSAPKQEGLKEVKDDLGRKIYVKEHPSRVMALSSSLTEMLYVVCPDSQIIARTQNCNYPPQVLSKPVVNNYPIDYEKILLLKPDIIFAKEGIISLEEAARIEALGIPFYFQRYDHLKDIYEGLEEIGEVLGRKEQGTQAADSIRRSVEALTASVQHLGKPSVLFVISLDKIYVFGKDSYVSDVIAAAGGKNAMDKVFNNPFPQITSEYIMKLNPDVIVGPRGINETFATMYPELKHVAAVKSGRVYPFSGDLISRPGPRIGLAVEQLIRLLHPGEK